MSEPSKGKENTLVNCYRKENILLQDKLDNALNNIKDARKECAELQKLLEEAIKKKDYWEVKYNKKSSWFFS